MKEITKAVPLDDSELENVAGGAGGAGYYMTVGSCSLGYLPLPPQPFWDQFHELAQMLPGAQVFTYGQTTGGTWANGASCTYAYVCYNGTWGWANSSYLRY